ncbi:hypothetical protein KKE60_08235 [Patescibacteria group bacterium]|nr:hypothetical protein [Patescibacteria group bacterium]
MSLEQEYDAVLQKTFGGDRRKFEKWLLAGEPRDTGGRPFLPRYHVELLSTKLGESIYGIYDNRTKKYLDSVLLGKGFKMTFTGKGTAERFTREINKRGTLSCPGGTKIDWLSGKCYKGKIRLD